MREYESPSSCYTYDHCPQKYKFRYIDKLPDPSGPAAKLGIAFEEVVYPLWNTNRSIRVSGDKIDIMVNALFSDERVSPLPKYISTQSKIDVPVGNTRLLGYIDMLLEDYSIVDLKTSKNLWDDKKLSETEQHIAYPYGCMKQGLIPNIFPVIFRYVIVTTTKIPKVQIIDLKVTEEDFEKYERRFISRTENIRLELFQPKRTYECNWCPYKSICPAWND